MKPRVREEITKTRIADRAPSDVLVAVDSGTPWPLRVVDVDRVQAIEPHGAGKRADRLLPAAPGHEVVPRGMDVTRVEADGDTTRPPQRSEDVAQMREAVTDGVALPRGRLEQDADADPGRALEGFIEPCRDPGDARGFSLAAVRAGVQDEGGDAEAAAARDLVRQGRRRLRAESPGGRPEVDEIRSVRDDVRKRGSTRGAAELPRLAVRDFLPDPAAVVLDENLKDPAARGDVPLDRAMGSSRDRVVRADQKFGGGGVGVLPPLPRAAVSALRRDGFVPGQEGFSGSATFSRSSCPIRRETKICFR